VHGGRWTQAASGAVGRANVGLCPVRLLKACADCNAGIAVQLQWLLRNDAIDGASAILRTAAKAFGSGAAVYSNLRCLHTHAIAISWFYRVVVAINN